MEEKTGLKVIEWAKKIVSLGAGEILLTSVDKEGMQQGYDVNLIKNISNIVEIPVIASGGMGTTKDMIDAVLEGGADAVSMASVLHYNKLTLGEIRKEAMSHRIEVREFPSSLNINWTQKLNKKIYEKKYLYN